jgi:hypothetical protein
MREAVEQGGSLLVCLSICVQRAALKTPPPFGRTLSCPQSAAPLSEVRTPAPKQVWVPFRRFCPVAEGVGRNGTPVGQACTADSEQTKRNGAKHDVQQSHPSSAALDRTQKPKPLKITASTSSSILQPRKAGRTTKATTKPAPSGTASMPGGISRSSPRRSRRGRSSPSKATLHYREVEDEIKSTTFKHRIAEIHATSMKRLSKIEAADDPSDGAGDE